MPCDHAPSFWENGFLFPVDIFTPQEAETLLKNYHRYLKMYGSGPRGQRRIRGNRIFRLHLVADWAMKVVRHPRLVAAVSAVLGSPNLLCWSSDLCVKPAGSSDCFGWHQDEAYADLAPHTQVLTAWVAITRADRDNASVKYIRGSHLAGTLPHRAELRTEQKNLVLGQTVDDGWVDQWSGSEVGAELEAGQGALHAWRTVHSSEPNNSQRDRVGLAIRYMTGETRQERPVVRDRVSLVAGEFNGDWFELEKAPLEGEEYSRECWREHKMSMEREWERRRKSRELGMLPSHREREKGDGITGASQDSVL